MDQEQKGVSVGVGVGSEGAGGGQETWEGQVAADEQKPWVWGQVFHQHAPLGVSCVCRDKCHTWAACGTGHIRSHTRGLQPRCRQPTLPPGGRGDSLLPLPAVLGPAWPSGPRLSPTLHPLLTTTPVTGWRAHRVPHSLTLTNCTCKDTDCAREPPSRFWVGRRCFSVDCRTARSLVVSLWRPCWRPLPLCVCLAVP